MNFPPSPSDENETLVGEVMLRNPKTLPAGASIAEVRASLDNDHVHLVLLIEGRQLVGSVNRDDLLRAEHRDSGAGEADTPALPWSMLEGRTVTPVVPSSVVQRLLIAQGARRLAVVDDVGSLLGLACLKRRQSGFCSDAGVEARARSRSTAND